MQPWEAGGRCSPGKQAGRRAGAGNGGGTGGEGTVWRAMQGADDTWAAMWRRRGYRGTPQSLLNTVQLQI